MQLRADLPYLVGVVEAPPAEDAMTTLRIVLLA